MANTKGLNEILPLQVAKGHVVEYQGQVFGDRGTLQVRRGGLHRVKGKYDEVDPAKVPDVAELSELGRRRSA